MTATEPLPSLPLPPLSFALPLPQVSSLERELSELTDAKESSEQRLEHALQSSKARLRQVSLELQLEANQTAEAAATAAATAAAAQTKERADVQQSRAGERG